MLIIRLFFGGPQSASASFNSKNVQDDVSSKVLISRTFSRESSMITDLNQDNQPTIVIPRGGNNSQSANPSKFSPGSKAKSAAKRDFARSKAPKTSTSKHKQSGGGFFADAFTVEPNSQVEIEMDCWVDFLLNLLRAHPIQGARVDRDQ